MGESERQLEDAASVIRMKATTLDVSYVEHWVAELGLEEQWKAAKNRAG